MMEEKCFAGLKYVLSYPEGFCPEKQYPLVIFLHGAGTRGDDLTLVKNNVSFCNLQRRQTARGYLLLAPQCTVNNWNEVMAHLIELVDHARKLACVDSTRVYLTGNSMGGYGTWELAALRPAWFAAILPVCGGGIGWMAGALADIPVRAIHGLCDPVVDPIESLQMVKAVNRSGGYAELILYPRLEHNSWDAAYTNEANYDWLLSFTSVRTGNPAAPHTGEYYG